MKPSILPIFTKKPAGKSRRKNRLSAAGLAICMFAFALPGVNNPAAQAQSVATGPSGLPLPRFVSLKSERVNMRVGPGRDYKVEWMFVRKGLPIEIIQEFDNWRKVRDSEGSEGWILQSLLSGRRTALAAPWQADDDGAHVSLHAAPDDDARIKARLEPNLLVTVNSCNGDWCRVEARGHDGHVRQNRLWGVYPGEKLE